MTKLLAAVFTAMLVAGAVAPAAEGPDAGQPAEAGWKDLFDGKTLDDWKQSDYGGDSQSRVEGGTITIPMGERLAGITYTGEVPKTNYEVEVEARRVMGTDFFVGLTFPVGESHASLILGGWGGSICGISSFDGDDANHNDTRKVMKFKKGQWYKARLRVEPERIRVWLDGQPLIDADTKGKKIDVRPEIAPSKPFGLSTFATTAEVKSVRLRELPAPEGKKKG